MKSGEIRRFRKQLNLAQSAFAKRLGVGRVTVSRWETGYSKPSPLAERGIQEIRRKSTTKRKSSQVR